MSAAPRQRVTPEEYLRLERAAEYRSEYLHGEIYAMAGATGSHNYIAGNIYNFLRNAFKNGRCKVYMSDMRVSPNADAYFYPDVVVACDKIHFLNDREDNLLNPTVIFGVKSRGSSGYGHGNKFVEYRAIRSLRDYILVSRDRLLVEHHTRQGDKWVLEDHKQLSDQVTLASLNLAISLETMYEGVEMIRTHSST
jgi:Uma2 family endonuclease